MIIINTEWEIDMESSVPSKSVSGDYSGRKIRVNKMQPINDITVVSLSIYANDELHELSLAQLLAAVAICVIISMVPLFTIIVLLHFFVAVVVVVVFYYQC